MFRIVGANGEIRDCYGCFVDEEGDVQFIIAKSDGTLIKTNNIEGYWKIEMKGGEEK